MNQQKYRKFVWWCYAAGLLTIFSFSRDGGSDNTQAIDHTQHIDEGMWDRLFLVVLPAYVICAILGGIGILGNLIGKKWVDGLNNFILLGGFLLLGYSVVFI